MRKDLLLRAIKMNKNRKYKKGWQMFVRTLAVCVVFCTTYALILPAITIQENPICGMEAHVHTESCYGQPQAVPVGCGLDEGSVIVHQHGEFCHNEAGDLVCLLPEIAAHTHVNECYITEQVLCCPVTHIHSEACAQTVITVICGIEESQEHTHSEACYEMTQTPCEEPDVYSHVHENACWQQTTVLSCGEELVHIHDESCSDPEGNLICPLPAAQEHIHSESCLIVPENAEPVLVCDIPEHTHDSGCYPLEEEPMLGLEFSCGYAMHTHDECCRTEDGTIICTIPEHTHEAACAVEDLDLTADVESKEEWMRSVSSMTLSGERSADVLAVAQTQLGYQESVRNVILAGDTLKGYTRYGAWFGEPYADWNTLFVAFCLEYAAVEDFPVEADAGQWAETLKAKQLYRNAAAYEPKPGDLVFLGNDQIVQWVGIVEERIPASGQTSAQLRLIAGDRENQVSSVTLDAQDIAIMGYASVLADERIWKTYEGADFTVSVALTPESMLPETVELLVREILPGTEEYENYYNQSVEALMVGVDAEEPAALSFARFFDISFLNNGEILEPAAPVEVRIVYRDAIVVGEEENSQIVHFAKDGVEVLTPDTSLTTEAAADEAVEQVDTFAFTQDSFSVTGTVVSARAANNTATKVNPWEIDNTGNTMYVLYTQIGTRYYALSGAADSYPVEITVNGNNLTLPTSNTQNLFWTFVDKPNDNTAYLYSPIKNVGTGRHLHPFNNGANNQNITTSGAYDAALVVSNDTVKIRGANNNFVRFSNEWNKAGPTTDQNQATSFYVAAVGGSRSYNVWFDGTLGGMMSYYGAANTNIPATVGTDGTAVVELPEIWGSSTKYDYVIKGWYDINSQQYYPVNPNDNVQPTAVITGNTVFYADWIAATYDVGQDNEHVVDSIDTNDFITTYVFDYNALFNVMSQAHTGSITAASHSESWTIYNNGETVPYRDGKSLGFAFVDYDNNGEFSYASNRDNTNTNQSGITAGILEEVRRNSGQDLLDLLFNPDTEVIGKHYVGTGNYLFQYMDSTTANYDGEHDGYYYLDARLNAASYHQSEERFYLYDYLERTSDSNKDGGAGRYSDLLPFNSPYIFEPDQLNEYADDILRPGYEYDAKDGGNNHPEYNSLDDATTNYFFGLRTDIEFFLPNDTNNQDAYGNYGNISTRGEHMVFDFHGDDDVWVFVDGELLLDIGGLHGIMHGHIDFSTGTIAYGPDGNENQSTFHMEEGTHHMTIYYMERGSSQSNCAIYFNIAPRYDLKITKEDIASADHLNGAVFAIYDDEAMTDPSELWNSFAEHEADAAPTNIFTVVDGVAKCWGISAGKTYYIRELTPPPGYPASDDLIRITLNNRGTATIETTTLHGPNGEATEGFAVIKQDVNDTLKVVALAITNQLEGETTEVRVKKVWDEDSVNLPEYITVYLTADGERIGRSARLTESNGWSYTWTGLPKHRGDGIDEEVVYVVEEVFVPDYITVQGDSVKVENHVDWVRVGQMSDNKTFLLVHNGNAMTYNGSFGWMDMEKAKNDTTGAAQWKVSTDHDGFHLKNDLGYTLTYGNGGFYGINNDAESLNQVFYYLNSRLMVHDHDVYYQFGTNGTAVQEDGMTFQLYQKEILTGLLTNIINRPVDEEKQTFVEVNKVWQDGAENHINDSITVRLYAGSKDTGRYLILNADNGWHGSFDDLPYYQDGTDIRIEYLVAEDRTPGYSPTYSDGETLPGRPVSFWQHAETVETGSTYRIYSGGWALTVASDNTITTAPNDLDDLNQQWKAVYANNKLMLQNVGTNRYLRMQNNTLSTTTQSWSGAAVTFTGGMLTVGGRYLEIGSGYASVTSNASNVDWNALRVTRWTNSSSKEGLSFTITNKPAVYTMPETGGHGTASVYTFGVLLSVAAILMYLHKFGPRRRKGGE